MGCISHVVVLFSLVGTLAYSQQFYEPGVGVVQNDPLLDKSTGENFANVFERSLQMCGAFTNEEAREYKQIIIVLTDAFGSFPDLQKAPPGVLKATAAGFASAVAERTAADIGTGELWEKTRCVIQALRKAFIVTTGVTNPFFITEVEKLIEIFYLTKGISLPQFANQGEDIGGGVQGVEAIPTGNLEGAAPNALGEAVKGNKKKPSGYLGSGLISNTFHGIFGGGHKDDSYDTYSTESYDTESYTTYSTESYDTESYNTYSTESYDTESYTTGESDTYETESYTTGESDTYETGSYTTGESDTYETGSYTTGESDTCGKQEAI
ncbi:aggregate spidroin 1A variant 1, partial [Nephila pilipes]